MVARVGKLAKSLRKMVAKDKHLKGHRKPPRMTPEEKRLVREMHFDREMPPAAVAKAVGRDLSCICRLLAQKKIPKPIGRPRSLSAHQIDKAVKVLDQMVDKADALEEITCAMLKRRCRFTCCEKVLANAIHSRGYWFRTLRKKMILTPGDVKQRFLWAKKYKDKTRAWWLRKVHIHLDNHHFKVPTTCATRQLLAKRRVRGVYRRKQKSLRSGHVKPDSKLRLNTGAKGFLKMGGVGGGRSHRYRGVTAAAGDTGDCRYRRGLVARWCARVGGVCQVVMRREADHVIEGCSSAGPSQSNENTSARDHDQPGGEEGSGNVESERGHDAEAQPRGDVLHCGGTGLECDGRREVDRERPEPQIESEAVGDSGEKGIPCNDEHFAPGVVRGEPLDDGNS